MGTIGPVMLDIDSTELSVEDKTLLSNPLVGGLILFARNFKSAQQVYELTQSIKAINPNIIIAVDQEGGRVQRFKNELTLLPALGLIENLYQVDQNAAIEVALNLGELMALEIQSVGCDISFAPVLDLGLKKSRVIGDRAFSENAAVITNLGNAYIQGMKKGGMLATGKHFPGHGSIEADSHHEIPIDERSFDKINSLDIVPFKALSKDLGAMMPAHVIYNKVDDSPAGFSSYWLQQILRKDCGFNGVIFSDDLSMKGAEVAGSFTQRAKQALNAGCDMILVCNDRAAANLVLSNLNENWVSGESHKRLNRLLSETKPQGLLALKQTDRWQQLSRSIESFKQQINQ